MSCRAQFNTKDGWTCDCPEKHPRVCSESPFLERAKPSCEAILARLVKAREQLLYVSSLAQPGIAEYGDATDELAAAWAAAREHVKGMK